MNKGDIVIVYEDPITRLIPEGKVRLVKRIIEHEEDFGMDRWTVVFLDEPGRVLERWI